MFLKTENKRKKQLPNITLVFPRVCLVGGVEKWKGGKLICLVENKSERIENVVYINWLLYPYYIICKK